MAAREELNPSEWRLMKAVWQRKRATVRELHEDVVEATDWALSTTKTLLERMEQKGLLKVGRVGPVRQYRAARTQKDLVPRAVKTSSPRWSVPVISVTTKSMGPALPAFSKISTISDCTVIRSPGRSGRWYSYSCSPCTNLA